MSLRSQVKAAFDEVDTEKTGKLSADALGKLLRKLNPEFTDADVDLVISKCTQDADKSIKFDNFVDVFTSAPPSLRRELSKPIADAEMALIKEAFAKFDKDNSGKIDLKELQGMCKEMGKALNDKQAQEAMSQLDRNGDGTVDFDEFVLWWTCTPGLGGYNHVALGFLKTKLSMASKAKKYAGKIASGKVIESNECIYEGSFDITPNFLKAEQASDAKSGINFALKKLEKPKGDGFSVTVKLKCKSPDDGAVVMAAWDATMAMDRAECPGEEESELTKHVKLEQNKDEVLITFQASEEELQDCIPADMVPIMEAAVKKMEGQITFGSNFEEMIANPLRPLPNHFRGLKWSGAATYNLEVIGSLMDGVLPDGIGMTIAKVFAGMTQNSTVGFDDTGPLMIACRAKELALLKSSADDPVFAKELLEASTQGLENFRRVAYAAACTDECDGGLGMIKDGAWNAVAGASPESAKFFSTMMKAMGSLQGCEKITIGGLPGCCTELEVNFDRVNPFCMVDYVCGSWPKNPEESRGTELLKPITDDETARIKEIFKKYDKDGSNSIDVKELKGMIVELGGTITDEEVDIAMKELDVNGDGSCSFDEFSKFWSSKSGLGGHSSTMLKFLKMKLSAGSALSKAREAVSNLGGAVSTSGAEAADTVVKWAAEYTPGLQPCGDKMSATVSLDVEDTAPTGALRAVLVLAAKDAAAAGEILAVMEEVRTNVLMMTGAPSLEAMFGFEPQWVVNGANIEISCSPPAEMVEMAVYSQEDMMRVITPLIKAVKSSGIKLAFANTFDDFLAAPDTPFHETFMGAQYKILLGMSAFGRGMLFNMGDMMLKKDSVGLDASQELEGQKVLALGMEVWKMFTGADATTCVGWHKANLSALVDAVLAQLPFDAADTTTPAALAKMIPVVKDFPGELDLPDEIKELGKKVVGAIQKLDSFQSVAIENAFLPKAFSQNGLDATVAVRVKFEEVKPFALMTYLAGPVIDKAGLRPE